MWIEIARRCADHHAQRVILYARMWIEIMWFNFSAVIVSRHPLCEDVDWNVEIITDSAGGATSSSMRGCGLKSVSFANDLFNRHVILYARMWIEIQLILTALLPLKCHPLCEDVDWNLSCRLILSIIFCYPLCEGLDWNRKSRLEAKASWSHPPREDVDWNYLLPP